MGNRHNPGAHVRRRGTCSTVHASSCRNLQRATVNRPPKLANIVTARGDRKALDRGIGNQACALHQSRPATATRTNI
jgi:hypothetical protein